MINTLLPENAVTLLHSTQSLVDEFEWGQLTWFAGAALNNCEKMTVGRCILKPDCANPLHRHPNCTEVLVVQQGRIMHTIENGEEVEMNAGDTITIPANLPHRARNIGESEAVLTIVFSSAERETIGE